MSRNLNETVRIRNAFNEAWDWFHAFLGFLSAVCLLFPYWWIFSLVLTFAFFVYEALQAETPLSSYADLAEFLCGFTLGLIVVLGLKFNGGV